MTFLYRLPGGRPLVTGVGAEDAGALSPGVRAGRGPLGRGSRRGASRHARWLRSRRSSAGCHARRLTNFACAHFFPRSVGLAPTHFRARGAFARAPSTLCQSQAMPSISSYSANPAPPQRHEETRLVPLLKMQMDHAGTSKFLRQGFPLTPGAQNIYDCGKDLARRHRLPPASRSALILALGGTLSQGYQRLNLRPKLIGNFPRFYLWHLRLLSCLVPSNSSRLI